MEISWTRAIGSALAAVSSAVLLSMLGVAGTLVGAALGSLVITIGGSIYSNSLVATKDRVLSAPKRTQVSRDMLDVVDHEAHDNSATSPAAKSATTVIPWGQRLRMLPWKSIIGGATVVFVLAMGVILSFELATGRPVSSFTGGSDVSDTGTSVPGIRGRTDSGTDEQDPPTDEAPQDDAPQEQVPQEQVPQDPTPQAPQPGGETTPAPQPDSEVVPEPQSGDQAPPEPQGSSGE